MSESRHYWNSPFVEWRPELSDGWATYVCRLRRARSKARVAAVVEALSLLSRYRPIALRGGPLAEEKGTFWVAVSAEYVPQSDELFQFLGYTDIVRRLVPADGDRSDIASADAKIRWKGEICFLKTVYVEDEVWMRSRAPDRRAFLMQNEVGDVVPVYGYRGDGYTLSRRGLPTADARLLANLVTPDGLAPEQAAFLDPFAGVGGIVIEARDKDFRVVSADIDPILRHGLKHYSGRHCMADAARLPFRDAAFHAIATEPPFHEEARPVIAGIMDEFNRLLQPGGKLAVMAVDWQIELLQTAADRLGLELFLAADIDRKGTDVAVCAWRKPHG